MTTDSIDSDAAETNTDTGDDEYERYEALYNPARPEYKKARQKRSRSEIIATLTDAPDGAGDFQTTYKPSRHEEGWLLSSLSPFYEQDLITDVLTHVKGGKEASVYCCEAHPTTGLGLVAAKVYRPRKFRNLRNDKMYQEGRAILTADGSAVKKSDTRVMRALGKKSDFGMQVAHTSWLMHEFTTMDRLFRDGGAVPQPVASGENAILMSYQGDTQRAAPTLSEVSLEWDEAEGLFREVLRNIELMLRHELIHGDLSAYNILYWQGKVTLIDFPQVSSSVGNSKAQFILQRDITRVCDYFARQGVSSDPDAITKDLWARYGGDLPDD